MATPRSVQVAVDGLPVEAQKDFNRDYRKGEKSILVAYIAWLLLGCHYLYLGRVGVQFAFWFTLGFLIVGWVVDFFRIPGMVNRKNDDLACELVISQYKLINQPAPLGGVTVTPADRTCQYVILRPCARALRDT
jgi:hypothetical protein